MTETKTNVLEYKSLGALLIEDKVITQEQLDKALHRQREKGGRLGELIVEMGFASEHRVLEALAKHLNIPYLSPDTDIFIDQDLINLLPDRIVRQYNALPISIEGDTLTVAMLDPRNIIAIDDLRTITKYKIRTAICEMLEMKAPIRKAILNGADIETMRQIALELGMTTLRESGLQKVKEGITTPEEVLRATSEED